MTKIAQRGEIFRNGIGWKKGNGSEKVLAGRPVEVKGKEKIHEGRRRETTERRCENT